jgi:hypothetical protein
MVYTISENALEDFPFDVEVSHPSRKNKDAARVGHPHFIPLEEVLQK